MISIRILYWLMLVERPLSGSCVLLHPPDDTNAFERHLVRAIVNISVTYFTHSSPLVILTADAWYKNTLQNEVGESVFRNIHAVTNWPVLTFSTNSNVYVTENTVVKHGSVIVLLNVDHSSHEDVILQRMLSTLVTCSSWNPRARYVIVSTAASSSTHGQRKVAASVLNKFSSFGMTNAILLISEPFQKDNSEANFKQFAIDIFTLSQHVPDKYFWEIFDVTFLDRWGSEEGRRLAGFSNKASLFRSKPITDMGGRNVTVMFYDWPLLVMSSDTKANATTVLYDEGLEVRLMKTVAENSNFTFDFRKAQPNVTAHGYFGAQWLETDVLKSADATWTHFTGAVSWFVPRERAIPRWQSIIKIFSPSLWLLVLLVYVLSSLIFWVLGNTRSQDKETASFRNVVLIFMNTLGMILSETVYKKPKNLSSQIFFLVLSLYFLHVNNAYQSSLIGFLTNPGQLPRIEDIDSLLESGVELGIQRGCQSLFNDTSDPRNNRILKSFIVCSKKNFTMCLNRMAYEGNLAVAGGRVGLEFLAYTKYMKNGKPLYVPFKDSIQEGHMVIYLKKGSILLERIDSIVLRLQNAGIIDKWVNDIRRKFGKHFDKALSEDGFCVLTLSHLEGAFYLLLLGLFLSAAIWFLEIIHHLFGHLFRKGC